MIKCSTKPSHQCHTRVVHDDRIAHKAGFTHSTAISAGASAIGAQAIGTLVLASVAVGALAVGALAIGRLVIGRARIRRLEIDELVVGNLRIIGRLDTPEDLRKTTQESIQRASR